MRMMQKTIPTPWYFVSLMVILATSMPILALLSNPVIDHSAIRRISIHRNSRHHSQLCRIGGNINHKGNVLLHQSSNNDDINGNQINDERKITKHLKPKHNWTSQTAAIALPALAGMMTDPLLSMVDTLYVGRLGALGASCINTGINANYMVSGTGEVSSSSSSSIPLAALGACTSIFHLAFHCFRATTVTTTALVAGALVRDEQLNDGSSDTENSESKTSEIEVGSTSQNEAVLVAQTSIQQSLITGAILTTFLFAFGSRCLFAMGISPENIHLYNSAQNYLKYRSLAAPAVVMLCAAEGIFRGYGDVFTPWFVSLIVAAMNLVLDPFCMFGGGSRVGLGMGIKGAAVATAFSQVCGALVYALLLVKKGVIGGQIRKKVDKLYQPRKARESEIESNNRAKDLESVPTSKQQIESKTNATRQKRKVATTILRANASMVAKQGSLLLGWAYATSRATRMGPATVAAHQMALSIWMVVSLVLEGAGVAAQILMSREWEELRLLEMGKKLVKGERDKNDIAASPLQQQRIAIKSLSKYMVQLSLLQGLFGTAVVLLLHRASPSFILTHDPQVRHHILSILPHVAAQMVLVSATLVTEALAVGGGRFKWLAGGTAVSSIIAMLKLHGSRDLIDIWSGGIVALFLGRLFTALLAVLDMNGAFDWRRKSCEIGEE